MKLVSISVDDWRLFKGHHHISFSTDPEKPVTLLLGANGAGKTALLNAFTWCLYGDFTEGFREPDSVVNMDAARERGPAARTRVEITFEHDEDEFRVVRSTDVSRHLVRKFDLVIKKNGQDSPVTEIYKILPRDLKDLFFFPAETLSTVDVVADSSNPNGATLEVGKAIRALLAGDIYDRASEDLAKAADHEHLKPPKNYTSDTLERDQKDYEQKAAELRRLEKRQKQLPEALRDAKADAELARKAAEKYDPAKIKAWQNERDKLKDAVSTADSIQKEAVAAFSDVVRASHYHLASGAGSAAIKRLDQAEGRGLMPPKIAPEVMRRALHIKTCLLCGEPLTEAAVERIDELVKKVGDSELAARGMEVRGLLRSMQQSGKEQLDRLRSSVGAVTARLSMDPPSASTSWPELVAWSRLIVDVASQARAAAVEALVAFEHENQTEQPDEGENPFALAVAREAKVRALEEEIEAMPGRILEARREKDIAFSQYETRAGKSKDHSQKTAAIRLLNRAKDFFDEASRGLDEYGRVDFEKAINETYSDLVRKNYRIEVAHDFSVTVHIKSSGERIAPGQAETVLLTIAFLGAIARLAPHYEEIARNKSQLTKIGDVMTSSRQGFPVVLDAPTSPLDQTYEPEVIEALPRLLPQVIVPTSSKSVDIWEDKIGDKVGAVYVLELSSSQTPDKTVKWNGTPHTYSRYDKGEEIGVTVVRQIVRPANAAKGA